MLDVGNKAHGGLVHVCDAFGILGFVRFLYGYYMVLITRRRPVGMIGRHRVYAIDEIAHLYMPPPEVGAKVLFLSFFPLTNALN